MICSKCLDILSIYCIYIYARVERALRACIGPWALVAPCPGPWWGPGPSGNLAGIGPCGALGPSGALPWALPWALRGPCGDRALRGPGP